MSGDELRVHDVHRTFGSGPTAVHALRGVSLADLVNQHQAVHGLPQEQPPAPTTSRRRAVPPKKQMPQDGVPNSVFALGTLARSR